MIQYTNTLVHLTLELFGFSKRNVQALSLVYKRLDQELLNNVPISSIFKIIYFVISFPPVDIHTSLCLDLRKKLESLHLVASPYKFD